SNGHCLQSRERHVSDRCAAPGADMTLPALKKPLTRLQRNDNPLDFQGVSRMSAAMSWKLPGAVGVFALVMFTASAQGQSYVQIGENFRGLGLEDNIRLIGERVTNPDMGGDIDPQSYVQFVKRLYGVYDKTTGALVQSSSGNAFWNNAGVSNLGGNLVTD